MQAHLKAAQADTRPKLLKELEIDNSMIVNKLTGLCLNPKNKITNNNTDNKINKLVTVFALIFCTLDNNWRGDKPGLPPLSVETSLTGDKNWLAFNLVPRHCTSALSHLL